METLFIGLHVLISHRDGKPYDREQHLSLPEALKLGTLEQIALYAVQHLYDLF